MEVLNVFTNDAFSVVSLTDAVNKIPHVPGRAGQVIDWSETPVTTTSVFIEEKEGALQIVNPTPRGGPGSTAGKQGRVARTLSIPHYQIDDFILADSVQNVRAFGTSGVLQTVQSIVNERMSEHVRYKIDPTLEHQRVGALKGIIINGDGTKLYNLFDEFGIASPAEVNFALAAATPESGAIRKVCADVVRKIATALGGIPFRQVYAFCGDEFFDALIASKETRETFLNQTEAAQLRGDSAYQVFDYGGIRFENYRGAVGGTPFIETGKCQIFPIGSPGLWRTVFAPADYNETVNTPGLPRYAKQYAAQNGKGQHLEVQANTLSYCTRPAVLLRGKVG